jgi:hypothetical protein
MMLYPSCSADVTFPGNRLQAGIHMILVTLSVPVTSVGIEQSPIFYKNTHTAVSCLLLLYL